MTILAMMRIKNEARWIAPVLRSIIPVAEKVLIFDDSSTDDTPAICKGFPQVTFFHSPFNGIEEVRDKNFLMEQLEKVAQPGDWILHIDGDEEIHPDDISRIQSLTQRPGLTDAYRFQVLYLWDRADQVRVDGCYRQYYRPSFFRFKPGARFHSGCGGGFHCGNVPEPRQVGHSDIRLLHYGYLHKEDRIRKYHWYQRPEVQPIPAIEDGYKHMVIGDVFPANSRFRHAGPLELKPL